MAPRWGELSGLGPGVPVVGVLTDYVAATVEQARAAVVGATAEERWDGADL